MNQPYKVKSIDHTEIYNQVLELKSYFTNIWWITSKTFPKLDNKTSYWYKRRKEKETNKFINEFICLIKQYPKDEKNRKVWKQNFNNTIDNFIIKSDLISMKDREL